MWELRSISQITDFFIAIFIGIFFAIIYIFFRLITKLSKKKYIEFICDVLFWILIGFLEFILFLILTNGQIRGYIIFGELLGFVFFCVFLYSGVFSFLYRFFSRIITKTNRIKKLINGFCEKTLVFSIKSCKKLLKFSKDLLYTIRIERR